MMDTDQIRKRLAPLQAAHDLATRQVGAEKEALSRVREQLACAEEAQRIIQLVAQDVEQRAHGRIASLVSRCLKAVFGEEDAYEFRIAFERKRGRTEARLYLARGSLEVEPTEASGGGVVDVTALALRIACLMLSRPARRRLLVLDEPLKHLSVEYIPAARELLLALSGELGLQVLMVTHNRELQVGNVIEME